MHFPRVIWTNHREANLREVAPGLYVAGADAVFSPLDFDIVVDLCGSAHHPKWADAYARYPSAFSWPIEDGRAVPIDVLDQAWALWYNRADNQKILVHCRAGVSRSVSVAYAILRRMGYGDTEARRRVLSPDRRQPLEGAFRSAQAWAEGRRG